MEKWKGRVVLVTGASSGIGRAIAAKLATFGLTVVACARNFERLQSLAESCKPNKVVPIKCDVSKEDEILKMFSKIATDLGGVDICINNAGLNFEALLLDGNTDQWRQMIDVNVLGLSICTRESVQQMRKRNVDDGFVINICSITGHTCLKLDYFHFYTGTKHMVKALTQGVNFELRKLKSKIRVMQISPGITETEIFELSIGATATEALFKACPPLQSEDIANAVVYTLSQPPHVQVCEIIINPTGWELS